MTKDCIMLSFTQKLGKISPLVDFHTPIAFTSEQKRISSSLNEEFQKKDIWEKIQAFASDHGNFRLKDINNFVREQVNRRIGEDRPDTEKEEIVRDLLEGGDCYIKPQEENKYQADLSEHKVNEAISRYMEGSPGLLVWGLRCNWSTYRDLAPLLGDIVPNCNCRGNYYWGHTNGCYDLEADIILIYPGSDEIIHLDIIEVKKPKNIKDQHVQKALKQLRKDTVFLLSILKEFSKDKFKIQLFIAFPDCDQSHIFDKRLLENIILRSDLENISSKLNLMKRNDSQKDNVPFLTVCARIIGRGIKTYSCRGNIECMIKYERNIERQLIMLDEEQTEVLRYLEAHPQMKNFAFAGGYGTGKTVMSLLAIQRLIERYKRQNVAKIFLYMVTYQDEAWEPDQSLSIYEEWRNNFQAENYAEVNWRTVDLETLFIEFLLDDTDKIYTEARKVNFLMKLLKKKHLGYPVIFFLDEISALGDINAYCWNLKPPGCKSRHTDPGDIVNCILAFNPSSSQTMNGDVRVSDTAHPRNPSFRHVEYDIPERQVLDPLNPRQDTLDPHNPRQESLTRNSIGTFRYQAEIGYSDDYTPSQHETNTLYLPQNLRNGFLTKQLHLRYRNSEKIQKFSKFLGHQLKMYLVTSPEELIIPCQKGDFLFWKDIGFLETMDFNLLSTTLHEMMNKIGENCRILLDGNLPVECPEYLKSHHSGEIFQKSNYFRGCETEAIIYIGAGSLEAFSRPKLKLGIISCYFKLATPTPEDNEELFNHYNDYVMSEGPSHETAQKYQLLDAYNYLKSRSMWGATSVLLDVQTKVTEECYKKYKTALEEAVENKLLIKI